MIIPTPNDRKLANVGDQTKSDDMTKSHHKSHDLLILFIGDPHFKGDNAAETELMHTQTLELIKNENPDIVIVGGDTLHSHEKINFYPFKRASLYLVAIRQAFKGKLVLLIGNHDRPRNRGYLVDDHAFNLMALWPNTLLVDKVLIDEQKTRDGGTCKLCYVPYYPVGELHKELQEAKLEPPYGDIDMFFMHQEVKGAKMGAITSKEGDLWESSYPVCFSGHIHDYQEVTSNFIYPGTPLQHGFGDRTHKTVSLIGLDLHSTSKRYRMSQHRRYAFKIPKKLQLILTAEELKVFQLEPLTIVKIKVRDSTAAYNAVMRLEHVKALTKTIGVKIVHESTDATPQLIQPSSTKVKVSFQDRFRQALKAEEEHVKTTFNFVFEGDPVATSLSSD